MLIPDAKSKIIHIDARQQMGEQVRLFGLETSFNAVTKISRGLYLDLCGTQPFCPVPDIGGAQGSSS